MKLRRILLALALATAAAPAAGDMGAESRIKDLAYLAGTTPEPLLGYGLVTGLGGTGDGQSSSFTVTSLSAMLERLGVTVDPGLVRLKNVAAGANPMLIKNGIAKAAEAVVQALRDMAQDIDTKGEIANVAAISTNDMEIGELIAEAMDKVGKDGVITVEESKGLAFETEFVEGMQAVLRSGLADELSAAFALLLLQLIGATGRMSISEISNYYPRVSNSTISTTITKLWKEKKLVDKNILPENQRINTVNLTEKGQKVLAEIKKEQSDVFNTVTASLGLSAEQNESFQLVLKTAIGFFDDLLGLELNELPVLSA